MAAAKEVNFYVGADTAPPGDQSSWWRWGSGIADWTGTARSSIQRRPCAGESSPA
jgi:hypothetical protein